MTTLPLCLDMKTGEEKYFNTKEKGKVIAMKHILSLAKTVTVLKTDPHGKILFLSWKSFLSVSVLQLECKEPQNTWKELCPALGKRDLENRKIIFFF